MTTSEWIMIKVELYSFVKPFNCNVTSLSSFLFFAQTCSVVVAGYFSAMAGNSFGQAVARKPYRHSASLYIIRLPVPTCTFTRFSEETTSFKIQRSFSSWLLISCVLHFSQSLLYHCCMRFFIFSVLWISVVAVACVVDTKEMTKSALINSSTNDPPFVGYHTKLFFYNEKHLIFSSSQACLSVTAQNSISIPVLARWQVQKTLHLAECRTQVILLNSTYVLWDVCQYSVTPLNIEMCLNSCFWNCICFRNNNLWKIINCYHAIVPARLVHIVQPARCHANSLDFPNRITCPIILEMWCENLVELMYYLTDCYWV